MAVIKNNAVSLLAIDVGAKRIGVARALLSVRFATPLTTLENPKTFQQDIADLIDREASGALIIGLPRGMNGQDTEQTRTVRAFGDDLAAQLRIPVYWMDEAATSAKAEQELQTRGRPYRKADVDALAATYILEDFLRENRDFANV